MEHVSPSQPNMYLTIKKGKQGSFYSKYSYLLLFDVVSPKFLLHVNHHLCVHFLFYEYDWRAMTLVLY